MYSYVNKRLLLYVENVVVRSMVTVGLTIY